MLSYAIEPFHFIFLFFVIDGGNGECFFLWGGLLMMLRFIGEWIRGVIWKDILWGEV